MPGRIRAAITIDTEFPVSWDDAESAQNGARLACRAAQTGR